MLLYLGVCDCDDDIPLVVSQIFYSFCDFATFDTSLSFVHVLYSHLLLVFIRDDAAYLQQIERLA